MGQRIKAARMAAGLSQASLAEACGWDSASRVGNYEQDKREPSLSDLRLIAQKVAIGGHTYARIVLGEDAPARSHPVELNLEMLRSAIVSVKKALRKLGLEMDVYDVAPLMAFAYRERMKHPATLDDAEHAVFDRSILGELRGELGDDGQEGRAVGRGAGGTEKAAPVRKKAGVGR